MKINKSNISIPSRKIAKVTTNTKLNKLLDTNPKSAEILFKSGMHCIGCPMMAQETIKQGCLAHGMNKKEINELIKRLNEK